MTKVRKATAKDADVLAAMNREFNRQERAPRAVRACLRRGGEIVLLAEVEGEPAGFACAQVADSFCYDKPWAELTELYVRASHRRAGCGTALVRAVEAELARRGVVHVHILTGVRNRPARSLYEGLGYSHNRAKPEMLYDRDMKPGRAPLARPASRRSAGRAR
jgi:ribosomal protein S18 acetylase RimI-like enzyme